MHPAARASEPAHRLSDATQAISRSPVALAIAQEALRVEPAVGQVFRRANSDTQLGDVRVPAGTTINLQTAAVTKRTGPGWGVFDPSHWLDSGEGGGDRGAPEARSNRDPGNLVFGAGLRRCVGQHLATTELMALLAAFGRYVGAIEMDQTDADAVFIATEPHPTGLPVTLVPR